MAKCNRFFSPLPNYCPGSKVPYESVLLSGYHFVTVPVTGTAHTIMPSSLCIVGRPSIRLPHGTAANFAGWLKYRLIAPWCVNAGSASSSVYVETQTRLHCIFLLMLPYNVLIMWL